MPLQRHYSLLYRLCLGLDNAVRALTNHPLTSGEPNPGASVADEPLDDAARKHAAGLMRVNHAGEICAQGLYHGQALVSKTKALQEKMHAAAIEEGDHLQWCKQRLDELQSHTSYLNPLWYAGSFIIGAGSGLMGDKWSLGFVVETERQVIEHLASHQQQLPAEDKRSQQILLKMQSDEDKHRQEAQDAGAMELPAPVKAVMRLTSKIMVKTAYWL